MNAAVIYTSREEIEVYRFNYAATFFIPLTALLLQSYLPVAFHGRLYFFDVFDLPLLVTIFFGVARRNPIAGSITGCLIGLAQDVGSLEPGKLADLVILDKNPLDDIHNTNTIRYVMKNGELFEGDTLNQVWPEQKPLAPLWWWTEKPPAEATPARQ